jgi:vancomycin resistance protein YoaR
MVRCRSVVGFIFCLDLNLFDLGINFGGKEEGEVESYFNEKNQVISKTNFVIEHDKEQLATISARELELGYNSRLLARQAISIGRTDNILTNIYLISRAYINGVKLPTSYHYSEKVVREKLAPQIGRIEKEPVNALFKFENGRVTAFRPSEEGRSIDFEDLGENIKGKIDYTFIEKPEIIKVQLPIDTLEPDISTEDANSFGIKELLASGTSRFVGSIPGRVFNISLASSRVNGVLVAPNEEFSFAKALGDVSAYTGYQQAYVIKDGRTVLGDGGGVCQVSTTLFRAILNAGLPITERNPHSYRVGYYEQDSLPGFDATVYVPSVDLRFKNDTGNYILIQTYVDTNNMTLTFSLFGANDGREVTISKPVITNQTSAPPPLYQDDPTLPQGVVKQVDFAAAGATASFTREVKKDGKIIIQDKFVSHYRPWQAVYLKGTKTN